MVFTVIVRSELGVRVGLHSHCSERARRALGHVTRSCDLVMWLGHVTWSCDLVM